MMTQCSPEQFKNESGIYPTGRRVVVRPDEIEETTAGGIIIRKQDAERHQQAQSTGTFVAAGPECWLHGTEKVYRVVDGEMKLVEVRVDGFADPCAAPGDRVTFAKFGGLQVLGKDGVEYRILNDMDINAHVDEGVEFNDIEARRPVSGVKS